MGNIERSPGEAARVPYELIVIGGGIYGACLTLEASRRGLRVLLLEQEDFGGGASWSTLRFLHGGFRYLQNLDLRRFRDSVRERRWFFRHFPELVRPLPCLMPLYGEGLRRPSLFAAALALNELLSCARNRAVLSEVAIGPGRVLGVGETTRLFPGVEKRGLKGAGVWFDGMALSTERLLIEILRWACRCGAAALNYVEARGLVSGDSGVQGVEAWDRESGQALTFAAPVVVNCAGPACRAVAEGYDRDIPALFHKSIAFNLLLDRPPPSEMALAVAARRSGARTYFLVPWKGRTFAGTYHLPWTTGTSPHPGRGSVERFLSDLNEAVPSLGAGPSDILRIHSGFLPAVEEGSSETEDREVFVDHGSHGGPRGLFSVSGVKYTTARLVAERTLRLIFPVDRLRGPLADRGDPAEWTGRSCLHDSLGIGFLGPDAAADRLRRTGEEESVLHFDDLLARRCDWTMGPDESSAVLELLRDARGWEAGRAEEERQRLAGLEPVLPWLARGGRRAPREIPEGTGPAAGSQEVCAGGAGSPRGTS